jgi:hypothetical protein
MDFSVELKAADRLDAERTDRPTDAVSQQRHPPPIWSYLCAAGGERGWRARRIIIIFPGGENKGALMKPFHLSARARPLFASRDRGAVLLFVIILIKLSAEVRALGFN